MPDFAEVFTQLYNLRSHREIIFREASASGTSVIYSTDLHVQASVRYREVGFDPFRGVLYPENRVELHIWFRDWFGRSVDGASDAELQDLIRKFKGDVISGSQEHHSRFVVDGVSYRYDNHAFDERPDGMLFAVLVILQAA